MENLFKLGDAVVVCGTHVYQHEREPILFGTVTAVGSNTLRIRRVKRFLFWQYTKQTWHSLIHKEYHVELVKDA